MLTDITFCHGEGNLGRVCARRQCCRRYTGLKELQPGQSHAQAQMLCRPSVMLVGEASYAAENAYRFYLPVGDTDGAV